MRQNFFDGNLWYPLFCIKFFDTPDFLKPWRHGHEIFRHCEPKNFDGNLWHPLLCIKFFDNTDFLKHWRDAHEFFRHCETKKIRRKIVKPPIMHKFFRYLNFFWNIVGMPSKLFGTVRLKIFDRNMWYPLLCIKYFRYPKLSETLKECPRNFSALWDQNFSSGIMIPPIMHKIFRYPRFSETLKGCPRIFSALWDKKFSTKYCDNLYYA